MSDDIRTLIADAARETLAGPSGLDMLRQVHESDVPEDRREEASAWVLEHGGEVQETGDGRSYLVPVEQLGD